MGTTDTAGLVKRRGLLYPMLVIAAIAVIVFSAVGVATMMGWMPAALSGGEPAVKAPAHAPQAPAPATKLR